MNLIELDGSTGEGGGQILRTSLALSMCTGQPMAIQRIRAKRPKPGLMRQHLTCVQAAVAVCGAKVEGAELGSQTLVFEPGQVREVNGQKIVSYGTSSYGYDIRCADEFKIFTNINHTIVDPKDFAPNSFVDIKSDVCIIPPNSFVLARTVEYFRIPRSVLTICLGKCLTSDSRVVDADTGAYLPITEFGWGRKTLSMQQWELKPSRVAELIPQGRKPAARGRPPLAPPIPALPPP